MTASENEGHGDDDDAAVPAPSHEPAWPRPGAPNGWRRGKVLRTFWPPAAGTGRWLQRHGKHLVCVRHREDPLGLRRVVTVEVVVAPVRTRHEPIGLKPKSNYALRLPLRSPELRRALQSKGAWQERDSGRWWVRGEVIQAHELQDWLTTLTAYPPSHQRTRTR